MPIQSDYDVISGAGGDIAMGLTKGLMYQREREENKRKEEQDFNIKRIGIALEYMAKAEKNPAFINDAVNIHNSTVDAFKGLGLNISPIDASKITPDYWNQKNKLKAVFEGTEEGDNFIQEVAKGNSDMAEKLMAIRGKGVKEPKPDKFTTFGNEDIGYSTINERTGEIKEVVKGLGRKPKETKPEDKPIGTKKAQWYIDTYPDVFEGLDINSVASLPYSEVKDMINTLSTKVTEGINILTREPTKTTTYIKKGSGNKQTPLFPDTTNTSDWLRQKGLIR